VVGNIGNFLRGSMFWDFMGEGDGGMRNRSCDGFEAQKCGKVFRRDTGSREKNVKDQNLKNRFV
jgi:hypothetical protein